MAGRFTQTFRAFRGRNYSLFFAGQSLSLIGTWMQRTAVSWVVYSMTHSAFMLGLTIFASQFPSFLFSLLGGIASDRYNRYRLLLITQGASMIQAILMAILALTGSYQVWEILTLSAILGVINAFDMPARQPLVHDLVTDKADLPNALALNSAMVNLARLIGPALSGIVLSKFGAGICFLINAISFVAVITSVLLIRQPTYIPAVKEKKKVSSELAEGFAYLKNTPAISVTLLLTTIVSLFVFPYDTILPVFAKVIFHGDAATFGYIYSFIGVGAIAGTLFLAALRPGTDMKVILLGTTIVLGIGLILFASVSYFPLAMVFAIIAGFGTMSQMTICITIIQVQAAAHMRGRMMSYVALAYFGMLPLGSLIVGAVSQRIGAPHTILAQGIFALVIAAAFARFLTAGIADRTSPEQKEQIEETEEAVLEKL